MGFLDKYKNRMNRKGNDIGESISNNTIAFIEATFHASPTFRVLQVSSTEYPDITEMDARVVEVERMGSLREVLFRPYQGLNIGSYVTFDNDTWIAFDKWGSFETTGVKLMVQRCNRLLKWKDANDAIQSIWCVASASPLGSKANQSKIDIEWNKYDVSLPQGQLYVFVEKNPMTSKVNINHRFIFGSNVYEVFGIDDTTAVDENGFGLVQMTLRVTTRRDKDDFINSIAFNKYETVEDTSISTIETVGEDEDKGGLIW